MVEETEQEIQTDYSNDQLSRAKIIEIPDNLPEEVKRQLQQFNEMSMMLNNSLENTQLDEEDEEDEDEEDESESAVSEGSSQTTTYSEDSNAVYSDIF